MRIIEKITLHNKDVYKDLINSGEEFKKVLLGIINKLLEMGEVPDSFKTTFLTKIYKNKGSKDDLDSYGVNNCDN